MMVTVFRSRIRQENAEEYMKMAAKMAELAAQMPGYVSHKGFTAEDGERVTIVEFESEETHRAWAEHPGLTTRTSYVIDRSGKIVMVHDDLDFSQHVAKTLAAVRSLKH